MTSNVDVVLSKLAGWDREGVGVVGVCPAHSDGHPSLRIDINKEGRLLLFCRAGCSFGEVARALGVDARGVWEWPAGLAGVSAAPSEAVPVNGGELEQLERFVEAASRERLPYEYLLARHGVTAEMAADLRLGFTERGGVEWEPVGRAWLGVDRLVVPFYDFEGVAVGAQARALSDHEVRWAGLRNQDGRAWSKLGAFMREEADGYAVVTEGPSDALTAYAAGFSAVCVRGAAQRDETMLDDIAAGLAGRIVLVCGDNDAAGEQFAATVSEGLVARGVEARKLVVDPNFGDLTEWREANPDKFSGALRVAVRGAQGNRAPETVSANVWGKWAGPLKTHADIARAVIWYMGETGRDCIYVRGYGAVVFEAGKWWPGHEHKLRSVLHLAGLEAQGYESGDAAQADHVELIHSLGNKLGMKAVLDAVERELSAIVDEKEADDLDGRLDLLLAGNGVVNLRSGVLRPNAPELLMSTQLAVDYVPDAECPRWERFVSEVMEGDDDLIEFIQRLIGYGLTGETREHAFGILYGRGANGKSVFTETLNHVFGSVVKVVPFSVFEDGGSGGGPSPELARLRGARLVLTSEGEQGKPMKESLVKSMTGSDTMTARHLYQEEIEFSPRYLILMATNHKPVFHGVDEGLWRRVKLIPFARYFAPGERDHYLAENLKDEAEGILAWAVRGSRMWYEDGLCEPESIRVATASFRDTSDILAGFCPGVVVFEEGAECKLSAVHAVFEPWAEEEGITPYGARWLASQLEVRGASKVRKGSGTFMVGVRLTTEAERLDIYASV